MNLINEYSIIIGGVCIAFLVPIYFIVTKFVFKKSKDKNITQKIQAGNNSTNIQSGKDIKF